ncbi:MAG TPA: substrate-binding domain-containing protein [Chitinophagaceae bacterium]|nr:substrate-binding domain-containing protein [Chitinophagaceae bacterium]
MSGCTGKFLSLLILCSVLLAGCRSFRKQKEGLPDTRERGLIYVSADESFKPVVEELVKVYQSHHPATRIRVSYKPEAECFRDFLVDSIRMIISTRRHSEDERDLMLDSLGISPSSMAVARDAIAVVVNPAEEIDELTMSDIKGILKGSFNKNLIPVFDGVKATSTVRFVIDSVLRGERLTPQAVAARSSEGVIDFVSKNRGYIGFIGISWIGNPEDSMQLRFLRTVKMVPLESTDSAGFFVNGTQRNIHTKRYPMVRDLVYTLKENHEGLGHGFADFMSGEIGQLIFRRAYLAPVFMTFEIRRVRLKE